MINVGKEEKRFEVNKTALYVNIGMWIFFIILCIILISFAQKKLDGWFVSSSEKSLYNMITVIGIIGIIGDIIAMIPAFMRMKSYMSVCEYGIEGRAGTLGNTQVMIAYTDIAEVIEQRQVVIVKAKNGHSYSFCVRDQSLCANMIRSKL